jgi:molybdopterin/thiamine biosynthesis adenylyltransferase
MIKWEHWPIRHGNDLVQIGGVIPGITQGIRDADGWVWALLGLLDGRRTVDQIVDELVHRFPTTGAAEVHTRFLTDLHHLVQAGYVEDAAALPPDELSAGERERYSRGRALWRWMDLSQRRSSWDVQMRLRRSRVVVVGVGGIGGAAALTLALSGVGQLHLVEPDVVELSNLNRQMLFTERDVDRLKVEVAVERLHSHNSDITVTGEASTIASPAMLTELASQFDVVVLGADQPTEIRSWTNQACLRTGTVWVHGGYHGPRLNIGLYRPGTGPCYDCVYAAARERQAALPPRILLPGLRAGTPHPASAASAGLAGQFTAHAAMSLITGVPRFAVNREYGINLVTMSFEERFDPTEPWPGCPACGPETRTAS